MLGIKNRIKKRIVDILHHRGFNTMIGQIKWHGVTGITIDEFYVKKQTVQDNPYTSGN